MSASFALSICISIYSRPKPTAATLIRGLASGYCSFCRHRLSFPVVPCRSLSPLLFHFAPILCPAFTLSVWYLWLARVCIQHLIFPISNHNKYRYISRSARSSTVIWHSHTYTHTYTHTHKYTHRHIGTVCGCTACHQCLYWRSNDETHRFTGRYIDRK